MDPVILTIVGALGSLGKMALNETAKNATKDAYESLKKTILGKFSTTTASALLETLERVPATMPAAQTAQTQLSALNLAADPEIARAASQLAEAAQLPASLQSQINLKIEKFAGIVENKGVANFDIKL